VVRPDDVGADDEWTAQLSELERRMLRWTGNALSWFETTRAAWKLPSAAASHSWSRGVKTQSTCTAPDWPGCCQPLFDEYATHFPRR
jgi:hypothetical protein